MISIRDDNGEIINCKDQMVTRVQEFYEKWYSSSINAPVTNQVTDTSEVHDILIDEVKHALNKTKRGKAPGKDGITSDMLKVAEDEIHNKLAQLFTQCLCKRDVPEAWCNAIVSLLHQKGDKEDLGNYRPINLLSDIYKLFSKILTNRLEKLFDENQPREQAGFKSGCSTIDLLHPMNQLIEKTSEYNMPLF